MLWSVFNNQKNDSNMDDNELKEIIKILASGNSLTEIESYKAFKTIMSGDASPSQIGAFLVALKIKGETVEEIFGGAKVLRENMISIQAPKNAIDTVGTGGDGIGTYNISTASAFVLAGADIPVAKHGNRAISSNSGASDVLSELNVNINADIKILEKSLKLSKITFLNAPNHHPAMRNVGPIRVELGIRTIFNILGPLANPAYVKRQLTGVYSKKLVEPIAKVLLKLGFEHAWVVHGSDGLDEMTTTGHTFVAEIKYGKMKTFNIAPEELGFPIANIQELKGGNSKKNASELVKILNGENNAYRNIVLLNSAAGILISGKTNNLKDGILMAKESIDSGKAYKALKNLIKITNE